jgi:hypothetical protein
LNAAKTTFGLIVVQEEEIRILIDNGEWERLMIG